MCYLRIFLFGKFCLQCDEQIVTGLEAQKTQELFSYLLLHRHRRHIREKLASLLWDSSSTSRSRRYLRQALWQLQSVLDGANAAGNSILLVETDWLQVNPAADFWLDVDEFEQAFTLAQGLRGRELDAAQAQALQDAVLLYQGDLLENWYQDWCLFERERLQNMYLAILDKLMGYYKSQRDYETGIVYGTQILRCDYARERTHRRLMRLYYLAGDRTGALRQYEQCVKALDEELAVKPAARTVTLYNQIRADRLPAIELAPAGLDTKSEAIPGSLSEILNHLNQLRATLADAQSQVEQDIEAVKLVLDGRR